MDFLAIYIKESKKSSDANTNTMELIKGLLKSMQVAHQDKNLILFERVKTVIAMLTRGGNNIEQGGADQVKENKIVMTELM